MKYNQLGNSDLRVSEICLGTMTWGEQNTEADAHAQIDVAVERGINFLDAAEMYPVPAREETQGVTEKYIGTWLKDHSRDKIIVATKIATPGRKVQYLRGGPVDMSGASITQAVNESLKRLQTDYIDLYQIHWPARNVPYFGMTQFDPKLERQIESIQDQLESLKSLIVAGKLRYIGVSNETPWGLMEFSRLARELKLPKIVSVQNAYSLLNRTYEQGLTEIGFREQVSLLAYSPLAFGHLTGKYLNGEKPGAARLVKFPPFGQRYIKPYVEAATIEYAALAKKTGLSPAQFALAFVRGRWFVASTIIGATTQVQLDENLRSLQITLDENTLAGIEAIHLKYTNPAP